MTSSLAPPATVPADPDRPNAPTPGHPACRGCGEALAARWVVDAAWRAARGRLIAVTAVGCLEVFATPYPESAWRLPWLHSLFGYAPAVASGVAAALRATGRTDIRVLGHGGDGGTVDIGFGALSGMFERNDDVLFTCYDTQAPAGTRSGPGKDAPRIAVAHGIPYVATATVADPHDLERKVTRAMARRGARYLHVLSPCPLGWGAEAAETIRLARLAVQTGLFPLFEAEHGELTATTPIRGEPVPVEEYLRPQQRYRHLFTPEPRTEAIAAIQAIADENIRRYRLKRHSAGADSSSTPVNPAAVRGANGRTG